MAHESPDNSTRNTTPKIGRDQRIGKDSVGRDKIVIKSQKVDSEATKAAIQGTREAEQHAAQATSQAIKGIIIIAVLALIVVGGVVLIEFLVPSQRDNPNTPTPSVPQRAQTELLIIATFAPAPSETVSAIPTSTTTPTSTFSPSPTETQVPTPSPTRTRIIPTATALAPTSTPEPPPPPTQEQVPPTVTEPPATGNLLSLDHY